MTSIRSQVKSVVAGKAILELPENNFLGVRQMDVTQKDRVVLKEDDAFGSSSLLNRVTTSTVDIELCEHGNELQKVPQMDTPGILRPSMECMSNDSQSCALQDQVAACLPQDQVAAGPRHVAGQEPEASAAGVLPPKEIRGTVYYSNVDQLDQVLCQACRRGDDEEKMLLCDGCNKGFHYDCLNPPLSGVPEGDWMCALCNYIYELDEQPQKSKKKAKPRANLIHAADSEAAQRRHGGKPGVAIADLPDEVIVSIFVHLDARRCLAAATRVSKTWQVSSDRVAIWLGLGSQHRLTMPRMRSHNTNMRHTRAETDLRRAFYQAKKSQEVALRDRADQMLSSFWKAMARGELKEKQLAQIEQVDANSGMAMHDNWTAAHIAAFYGRLSTLQALVVAHRASLAVEDDGGLTPLALAAWSGEGRVVEWILQSGLDFGGLFQKGEPSSQSLQHKAARGRRTTFEGPRRRILLTPYGWAQQNGFFDIAALLEAHTLHGLERLSSTQLAQWVHMDASLSQRRTEYAFLIHQRALDGRFAASCSAEALQAIGWDAVDAHAFCRKVAGRLQLPLTLQKIKRPSPPVSAPPAPSPCKEPVKPADQRPPQPAPAPPAQEAPAAPPVEPEKPAAEAAAPAEAAFGSVPAPLWTWRARPLWCALALTAAVPSAHLHPLMLVTSPPIPVAPAATAARREDSGGAATGGQERAAAAAEARRERQRAGAYKCSACGSRGHTRPRCPAAPAKRPAPPAPPGAQPAPVVAAGAQVPVVAAVPLVSSWSAGLCHPVPRPSLEQEQEEQRHRAAQAAATVDAAALPAGSSVVASAGGCVPGLEGPEAPRAEGEEEASGVDPLGSMFLEALEGQAASAMEPVTGSACV